MHVLHLDSGRELRGGQRQLLLLARGLAQRGHQQLVLARRNTPVYEAAIESGIETAPLSAAALFRHAGRFDVIHAHDARSHTLAALAAAGRPIVVSRRVAFPIRTGPLSRWKYDRAARYLAVSQFVKKQMLAAGIPEEKISVVYDGVELPSAPNAAPRGPLVVAPSTGDPQKGSSLARDACRAAGVPLQFSSALDQDLPRASLFLYLSHCEGLGSAILLAMAHRTPVVASNVGGIPEIVEHGRTGLLVENTPASVAEAIRSVSADPAAAAARAEAAYAQLVARLTDAIMVAHTEQAYRLALGPTGTL